jgi:hypothetical protein
MSSGRGVSGNGFFYSYFNDQSVTNSFLKTVNYRSVKRKTHTIDTRKSGGEFFFGLDNYTTTHSSWHSPKN